MSETLVVGEIVELDACRSPAAWLCQVRSRGLRVLFPPKASAFPNHHLGDLDTRAQRGGRATDLFLRRGRLKSLMAKGDEDRRTR